MRIALSRNHTLKISYLLDQCIPPVIRDSKWFMSPLFWIVFGKNAKAFAEFKKKAPSLSEKGYAGVYKAVSESFIGRATDLNDQCVGRILKNISGKRVLEVGFGKAYLTKKLSKNYTVTAADIILDPDIVKSLGTVKFFKANVEKLPFKDKSFDTVICTHTLEHVQDIYRAVNELKRVAKNRIIIVVPRQRPYKYTFDLHLHFFPYRESLINIMKGVTNKFKCQEVGGDLFYVGDF
jgi:SAM-dependent methyltransferase